jgi:hypothetical protein
MNTTIFVAVSTLLAASLNVAWIGEASAQSFADSTGGNSQAHGELVATPAGIVPAASSQAPRRTTPGIEPSGESTFQAYADSTGGSSAARAGFLLDHAKIRSAAANQLPERGRFQPFLDSTGGSSMAAAGRVFDAAGDAAPPPAAAAPTREPAAPKDAGVAHGPDTSNGRAG